MADQCKRFSLLFYNVRSLASKDRSEESKCMLADIKSLMEKRRCPIPGE